jgi:CheY-like chemotaxis protein
MSNGRTYLLVEDDDSDVTYATREHHRAGDGRLLVVRDGLDAIKYLKGIGEYEDRARFPFPDAMLLDLSLPEMNGLQVLEWMRANPVETIRVLPVVVVSIGRYQPDAQKARRLGVIGSVVKPLIWEEVTEILRPCFNPPPPTPNPTGEQPSS